MWARLKRFLDDALPAPGCWPWQMPDARAAASCRSSSCEIVFPSGVTADVLAARLTASRTLALARVVEARAAPHDRTPECDASPGEDGIETTPKRTPSRRRHAPRRTLREHEVPTLTQGDILDLGRDWDGNPIDPAMSEQPIDVHALRLLRRVADSDIAILLPDPPIARGGVEPGLFGFQLQDLYFRMCGQELWWLPHRWDGTGGVADHVSRILRRKRRWATRYRWCVWPDGRERHQVFYPLSAALLASVLGPRPVGKSVDKSAGKGVKRTPKGTPPSGGKRTPSAASGQGRRAA